MRDGADTERFLRDLHERCWLRGLGWFLVSAAGQLLERSVVDRTVGAPERLVFEGAPVLEPPLGQDLAARAPEWSGGEELNTRAACPPLTRVEKARVAELKAAAHAALAPDAAAVRAAADRALAASLTERHGVPAPTALRMAEARHRGVLLPHVELAFDDGAIGEATVAEVLRGPECFVGETLADPLEGVAYGRGKAKVMRRDNGSLWIHSFAHGRTTYELKRDAAALEAVLRGIEPPAAVVDAYVRLLPDTELEADEEARLFELVRELSGVKARPLAVRVSVARQRRVAEAAEERRRATAEARAGEDAGLRGRRRVRLPAPLPDDERTPVLLALDEALAAAPDAEPPMRNADGTVAEIRARRPWGLHGLTDAGADAAEAPEDRVPPPEEPLITALGLLVERHVEHVRTEEDGGERAVSLPDPFLWAYREWRESRLPVVRAVVTAPLITREGEPLTGTGLDRARDVVFRIEPQLLALVPADPDAITEAEVVEALRFLVDDWLCDVAAGFAGRLVLLAFALTVIERVLLPERLAFFVTAGQRGGGKTTVLNMAVAAVQGRRPAAAAWSLAAEERRKALLAYLGEGVATLVWDNIERGAAVSCPSIEKALTAAEFTDRVLGVSRSATVPATSVQALTGNNIAPKGDMASRSLVCRLELERPDPENRAFRHPDPAGWTLANRARILRALYTLLRWNPQVRAAPAERRPSKTRFKVWWDLVGAPLELAAMLACETQAAAEPVGQQGGVRPFACAPEPVDFGVLFAAGEVEEEGTSGMRELVLLLREAFEDRLFSSADLAALLQAPAVAAAAAPHLGGPRDGFEQRAVEAAERAQALRTALEGATGKALPPGGRPRRAKSASACRWWWGGRRTSAGARSGRWSGRTPATRPTPTGWRSRRRSAARDRAGKHGSRAAAAARHSRLSRYSRATPGKAGMSGVRRRPRRPQSGRSRLKGGASDPVELLRRLRARGGDGTAAPASGPGTAAAGALAGNPGGSAALLRAAEAGAEVLAVPDPDLARERVETAAGLWAEAPDPARAGVVEVLPNGVRLHHCRVCGRLAAWGFGVALDRGRDGKWFCFQHQGRAG